MKEADYHCSRCQVGFCKDCINIKTYGRIKMEVCPLCQNPITNLTPFKPVKPFWENLPEFLFWPVQGDAWMMLVGWGLISLVLLGLRAYAMVMPAYLYSVLGFIFCGLLYYGLLIPYFYKVISKAEEGDNQVPDWTGFTGFWDSFMILLRFGMGCLAVFWPIFLFYIALLVINGGSFVDAAKSMITPAGVAISGLAGLAGLCLLPMALLIMGVFGNPGMVLNPVYLFGQIQKILKEYLIALAVMGGLLVIYAGIRLVFYLVMGAIGSMVKYLLFFPLDGVMQLYLFMVMGHLLGYMAYQCRYKLKWWPDFQVEPLFMVGGRTITLEYSKATGYRPPPPPAAGKTSMPSARAVVPPAAGIAAAGVAAAGVAATAALAGEDLARKINDGMSMLNHGRYEDASALFQEVLSQNPANLGALRGMVMTSLRQKDLPKVKEYAQKQGAGLVNDKAFDALWESFTEIKKNIPDFTFLPKDQFALARWLTGQDLPMEAAKALREVAVAYPNDPMSPKALYQCAELLQGRCGKPEAAVQMLEYILKRYPEAAFGDQVRAALARLKAGGA
jgi:TolA-binding protein